MPTPGGVNRDGSSQISLTWARSRLHTQVVRDLERTPKLFEYLEAPSGPHPLLLSPTPRQGQSFYMRGTGVLVRQNERTVTFAARGGIALPTFVLPSAREQISDVLVESDGRAFAVTNDGAATHVYVREPASNTWSSMSVSIPVAGGGFLRRSGAGRLEVIVRRVRPNDGTYFDRWDVQGVAPREIEPAVCYASSRVRWSAPAEGPALDIVMLSSTAMSVAPGYIASVRRCRVLDVASERLTVQGVVSFEPHDAALQVGTDDAYVASRTLDRATPTLRVAKLDRNGTSSTKALEHDFLLRGIAHGIGGLGRTRVLAPTPGLVYVAHDHEDTADYARSALHVLRFTKK
jgi:hypothetical protein